MAIQDELIAQLECQKLTQSDMIWAMALILSSMTSTSGTGDDSVTFFTGSQSFMVPPYDEIALTYYTGTNNIETQTFKRENVIVAVLDYTYVGGGGSDNDLISNIKRST